MPTFLYYTIAVIVGALAGIIIYFTRKNPCTYKGEKIFRILLTVAVLVLLLYFSALSMDYYHVYADTVETEMAAVELYDLGLVKGTGTDSDGNVDFAMDENVTRAEAVTMLVRMLGAEKDSRYDISFGDGYPFIDAYGWMYQYVRYAYEKGITMGVSKYSFAPNEPVDESTFLTMVLRALGYEDVDYTNPYPVADIVELYHSDDSTEEFHRSDMFLICKSALDCQMAGTAYTMHEYLAARGLLQNAETATPEFLGDSTYDYAHLSANTLDEFISAVYAATRARAVVIQIDVPEGTKESYWSFLEELRADTFSEAYTIINVETNDSAVRLSVSYSDAGDALRGLYSEDSISLRRQVQEILDKAEEVVSEIPAGASDYEKVKYIHDWLALNNVYDLDALERGSATSALLYGSTVCAGFAQAFDLLCHVAGVDCICVVGHSSLIALADLGIDVDVDLASIDFDSDEILSSLDIDSILHEWNKVCIDGEWYNVDITWDNQDKTEEGVIYDFFLLSDAEMEKTHIWDQYPGMSVANNEYDFLVELLH